MILKLKSKKVICKNTTTKTVRAKIYRGNNETEKKIFYNTNNGHESNDIKSTITTAFTTNVTTTSAIISSNFSRECDIRKVRYT